MIGGAAIANLPVAHAGHWAFYLVPIAIVLAAVIVSAFRERRDRIRRGEGE